MGWIARRRSSRLVDPQMIRAFRLSLYLVLGLFFGAYAAISQAGQVALKPPPSIGGSVGSRVTAGAVSVAANQAHVGLTANIAGKTVTVPASYRFAANAASVAVSAIRLNPTALVGSAVAAWLLANGLEYINGVWQKPGESFTPLSYQGCWQDFPNGVSGCYPDGQSVCNKRRDNLPHLSDYTWTFIPVTPTTGRCYLPQLATDMGFPSISGDATPCPAGTTQNGTQCVGQAQVPGQADWDAISNKPLPDTAAEELSDDIPLPLEKPAVDPTPQTIPLSDPYIDPTTGKPVRDEARIRPRPDQEVADTEIVKTPVNPQTGEPITEDPVTGEEVLPEEKSDFCKENPDALACWEAGEPEEQDLEKTQAGQSITPVSVGGSGSCPADKNVSYLGAQLSISFQPICTAAGWINPMVLALAWLAAGYILIGAFRES
jgi:hypothetical protein